MKKVLTYTLILSIIFPAFYSCSSDTVSNEENSSFTVKDFNADDYSDVEDRLAKDIDFLNLIDAADKVMENSNVESFNANWDIDLLNKEGDDYLSSITGMPLNDIQSINSTIATSTENLQANYPELTGLTEGQLQIIMNNAINKSNKAPSKACASCASLGRALMVTGAFFGGLAGASLGFYGVWAGATAGFWAGAAWTENCIAQNC